MDARKRRRGKGKRRYGAPGFGRWRAGRRGSYYETQGERRNVISCLRVNGWKGGRVEMKGEMGGGGVGA